MWNIPKAKIWIQDKINTQKNLVKLMSVFIRQ
jgi:hypothetical protein